MFIASYLNTSGLLSQAFEGNSEVCYHHSNIKVCVEYLQIDYGTLDLGFSLHTTIKPKQD